MKPSLQFSVEKRDFSNSFDVVVQQIGLEGYRTGLVRPIKFLVVAWGEEPIEEPTFSLDAHSARSLFQSMWNAGLRPQGFDDRPSHPLIAAKDAHIEDLRVIAFRGLRLEPPREPDIGDLARQFGRDRTR